MILNNNPAVDVDALMQRVRAQAQELRASGAIEFRRGEPRNLNELRLARSLDTQRLIQAHLNAGDEANQRVEVPRRLRPFGPVARFVTRVLNYVFKRQREYNTSLLQANREMLAMQVTIGEAVSRAIEDLAGLERYRIESFRELRAAIDEFKSQISGLDFAHHHTRLMAEDAANRLPRVEHAHERIDTAESDIHALSERLQSLVTRAEVHPVAERLDFAHRRIDSGEATRRELVEQLATRAEVRLSIVDASRELEHRIADTYESMLRSLAVLRGEMQAGTRPLPGSPAPLPDADDAVHALIADRFRGSRADIDQRLASFLPLISDAGTVTEATPLFDVGPGRGEWLASLKDAHLPAFGAETNRLLAEECRIQGLDVDAADMLAVLRGRANASLGAITAFHVVEHLPFPYLVDALREALRVLVPGGVLIFETPDPRNLIVASQTFYLDPTHLNPVPRELLQALLEGFGFPTCEVLELHPPDRLAFAGDDEISTRLNAFFSSTLDYAIVARAPRA